MNKGNDKNRRIFQESGGVLQGIPFNTFVKNTTFSVQKLEKSGHNLAELDRHLVFISVFSLIPKVFVNLNTVAVKFFNIFYFCRVTLPLKLIIPSWKNYIYFSLKSCFNSLLMNQKFPDS